MQPVSLSVAVLYADVCVAQNVFSSHAVNANSILCEEHDKQADSGEKLSPQWNSSSVYLLVENPEFNSTRYGKC